MSMEESTYLVQRLRRPIRSKHPLLGRDNPFAFGGGFKNGGLSSEAMDLIRDIWQFDYMGSAEFEFGAVPEALNRIAKSQAELAKWTLTFPLAEVKRHWKDKSKTVPEGDATVYVIAPYDWKDEVDQRIRDLASGKHDRLKEYTHLSDVLRPYEEDDHLSASWRPCGWLELDNGFFFFTDKEMFEQTAELFEVKVAV